MKNIILILFTCVFFFSCEKSTEKTQLELYNKIDTLLVKANNDLLDKKSRLAYTDSVSFILDDVQSDSLHKHYEFKLANRYYNLNLFEKYKNTTLKIQEKAIADNDTLTQAKCSYNLGGYYYEKYNLDSCFFYYNKAKNLSHTIKDIKLKTEIYKDLGRALFYQNQYLESEKNISIALTNAKKINNNEYIFECYNFFGLSQLGMKNYSKAIEYFNLGNKTLEKLKGNTYYPVLNAQNHINFCDVYSKKKDYKKLYQYAKEGVSIKKLKSLEITTYSYLKNFYGFAKLKLGDVTSIAEFKETLKIGDSLNFQPIKNTSNLHLGEYYLSFKDTLKANSFFKKVYQNNLVDDKLKALEKLTLTEPKNTSYLQQIIHLKDSLFVIERQTREKFARIEYETNEIISEKDTIQKQKESILQQLWSVSSIAVFIILAFLLFYFIKSRNIKNKELKFIQEQQNAKEEIYGLMLTQQQRIEEGKYSEKNRISQELHDGVMGKLMGIRLNLFILKKKQDAATIEKCLPFIDDIQSVEKEIRQIAHDLNQNLFDDNVTFISIVENLFIMIKSHSDIEFILQVDERIDWDVINNNIKINIYRIIQETLQNIDKYAQASKVNLNMIKKENEIHITITDNGIGFNPDINKKGIGLNNMKKRMEEINGSFALETKINIGTKITLIFQQ
ncbi:MAG: ATP-binding protein [Bacteroidota bacterium]